MFQGKLRRVMVAAHPSLLFTFFLYSRNLVLCLAEMFHFYTLLYRDVFLVRPMVHR